MSDSCLAHNYAGVFDHRVGFGRRPAVLVVDFVCAYTLPDSPFYAPEVISAVRQTNPLLRHARRVGAPVIFTVVSMHSSGMDSGMWVKKIPLLPQLFSGGPTSEIVHELERSPADLRVTKSYASAFFGTSLAATLTAAGVDTLILTGCSTSGCIRATAVDGLQHGFRVIVPRSCVADRHQVPHEASLFDIDAKYGDVVPTAEVIEYLQRLYAGGQRQQGGDSAL